MTYIFNDQWMNMSWLIKAIFELNLILLFTVCLVHSLRLNGWRRTLREFGGGFILTVLCESTGVLSGAYIYPGFQFYVFATPFGNPAAWVALIYIIMILTDRLIFGRQMLDRERRPSDKRPPLSLMKSAWTTVLVLALCDASIALLLDLVLDPIASIYNWWLWVPYEAGVQTIEVGHVDPYNFTHHVWMVTPEHPIGAWFASFFPDGFRYPTRLLGIPLINFIAWFVFVFVFTSQFRWVERQLHWSEWRKTWILWGVILLDVPVLCVLLIVPNI